MSRRRADALDAVHAWLLSIDAGVRRLARAELDRYREREPFVGWRVPVATASALEHLDLLLDARFPRTPPRVALVSSRSGRIMPHAERDGSLCLYPSTASFSDVDPVALIKNALDQAVRLIEESANGRNHDDFRAEFRSYWAVYAAAGGPPVWSLLEPVAGSRAIRVWRGTGFWLAAEDRESVIRWLSNRYPSRDPTESEPDEAVLLWFDRALVPPEYPRTSADVLRLAERAGADGPRLLLAQAGASPDRFVVIFGFPTASGPCFAGVTLSRPQRSTARGHRGADPLTLGYRPGRVPPEVIARRYFGAQPIRAAEVQRFDAAWVHGRGGDERVQQLRDKRVAVLGCGSVGAPVAIALAQAGVGSLSLIDPEVLVSANLGRHPLGADAIGTHKATALAAMIRSKLPHVRSVDALTLRWDDAARSKPELLARSDLVVCAIGDWSAEGALNEWHVVHGRELPVVYGWTEAHACAGHAVAIRPQGGCLQCGLSDHGSLRAAVTEWPGGSPVRQEPACGASFQPYGPIELAYITALVAELALDCLLGTVLASTHRAWIARRALLDSVGGELTPLWRSRTASRPLGGLIDEQPWPQDKECRECRVTAR